MSLKLFEAGGTYRIFAGTVERHNAFGWLSPIQSAMGSCYQKVIAQCLTRTPANADILSGVRSYQTANQQVPPIYQDKE
jgi:hypothetical protein